MELYKRFKGKEPEEEPKEEQKEESFNPVELEQTFDRAYRSRMDADTFFDKIRQNLIYLINQSSDILQHPQNRPTGDKWLKVQNTTIQTIK